MIVNRYIVLFNDFRSLTVPKGEARFWAWLSMEAFDCNVFLVGGTPYPLTPFDIY